MSFHIPQVSSNTPAAYISIWYNVTALLQTVNVTIHTLITYVTYVAQTYKQSEVNCNYGPFVLKCACKCIDKSPTTLSKTRGLTKKITIQPVFI